jgi:hypothetical protein
MLSQVEAMKWFKVAAVSGTSINNSFENFFKKY